MVRDAFKSLAGHVKSRARRQLAQSGTHETCLNNECLHITSCYERVKTLIMSTSVTVKFCLACSSGVHFKAIETINSLQQQQQNGIGNLAFTFLNVSACARHKFVASWSKGSGWSLFASSALSTMVSCRCLCKRQTKVEYCISSQKLHKKFVYCSLYYQVRELATIIH